MTGICAEEKSRFGDQTTLWQRCIESPLGKPAGLRHAETMTIPDSKLDLTGKLLIAMPGMGDARFARAVVCICAHSGEGAMGLIVNKPLPDLRLPALMVHLDLLDAGSEDRAPDAPVHFGGPVEHGRGFVLHSSDYSCGTTTLAVCDGIAMTSTRDILTDILHGNGPARTIMALGYAGWAPGQLEQEILQNGWLSVEASAELVFDTLDEAKWNAALRALGVDPLLLSSAAGHA